MIQEAERAGGRDKMWGYVWQGRAYEGLTCDALEWIASYKGGSIVEPDGSISVNNPEAARALGTAAGWIGDISPAGVLSYAEEEARGVFQSGNAVFMRNWPYAWSLANGDESAIKGKVGVVALPRGGAGRTECRNLGRLAALGFEIFQESGSGDRSGALHDLLRGTETPGDQGIL